LSCSRRSASACELAGILTLHARELLLGLDDLVAAVGQLLLVRVFFQHEQVGRLLVQVVLRSEQLELGLFHVDGRDEPFGKQRARLREVVFLVLHRDSRHLDRRLRVLERRRVRALDVFLEVEAREDQLDVGGLEIRGVGRFLDRLGFDRGGEIGLGLLEVELVVLQLFFDDGRVEANDDVALADVGAFGGDVEDDALPVDLVDDLDVLDRLELAVLRNRDVEVHRGDGEVLAGGKTVVTASADDHDRPRDADHAERDEEGQQPRDATLRGGDGDGRDGDGAHWKS
jgi:hypothetical protein